MEQNLKEKIEPQTELIMRDKNEKLVRLIELSKLEIPPELFEAIKQEIFHAYQDGIKDQYQDILDMYRDDPDALVDMLEEGLDS